MTIKLGLTGSIAMGKSTVAGFFAENGVPVWDADAEVHKIYEPHGAAVGAIAKVCPNATSKGFVDRNILKSEIAGNPALLGQIETAIKPLLAASRASFIERHKTASLVLFDIPLLIETSAENWLDYVLVVTAPLNIQKQRVLMRGTMSKETFDTILARQMPDVEKRKRADFVFDTSKGLDQTKAAVKALILELEQKNA